MVKKIETENDIEMKPDDDIEIEFLGDSPQRSQPKKKAGQMVPSDRAAKAKLKKKDEELDSLREEVSQLKEEFLRIAAEKDNLRKRLEREKSDYYQFALTETLREFLVILDNFERALSHDHEDDCQSLREGVELIFKQFLDVLKRQGVEPIELEDKTFDPRVQQAFITEESEKITEPTVSEELQKGYRLHDRLLRPTMVKVLMPKKEEES
jgi:molecular chaperone GrpE